MQTDTSYLEGIMNLDAKAGRSEEVARLGARLVSGEQAHLQYSLADESQLA